MPFLAAVSSVLSHTLRFGTRASRAEYWWWQLFCVIVGFVVQIVIVWSTGGPLNTLGLVVLFAVFFVPSLSVQVRRLHDGGISGWLSLIMVVPIVGPVVILVLTILPSDRRVNRWGPPPPPRTI